MNQITVLFFAVLKERVGTNQIQVSIPEDCLVISLKTQLTEQFPAAAQAIDSSLVAINQEFAFEEDTIPYGAEVALFPPVSGGSERFTSVLITDRLIDLNTLLAEITSPRTGAACIFTGMVRGETIRSEPHQTEALRYEAYVPMAEAKMRQVAEEIRNRWPQVEGISIVQRVGLLSSGTPTVIIACSADHRDSGVFEAARYGIDRLKEIVPIWKKEIGPGGEEWIEGKYRPMRNEK